MTEPPEGEHGSLTPVEGDSKPGSENITVLAIYQKIEQLELKIEHLHIPVAFPSADEAAALKERAPEMYQLMMDLARKNADKEAEIALLPYEHAYSLARRGQVFGIAAILIIFAFCGYLASLGGAGPYIAGVLGALNFAAIISAFMATRKGRPPSNEGRHTR